MTLRTPEVFEQQDPPVTQCVLQSAKVLLLLENLDQSAIISNSISIISKQGKKDSNSR